MLEIDGTLIVVIISFLAFMVIMQKIFYAPMTEIRQDRNNYINDNLEKARITREESGNIVKDYENTITQARIKANNIVFDSTSSANKDKSQVIGDTMNEVNNQVQIGRESILNDKNNAREALKPQIISLAHSISAKVLGEEVPLSAGLTEEMIDKALNR
ncbi:MAG: hypothetical protein A2287_09695 [Candidatus Melainabacteria bacterium RIFOXYA12_FULL_32_12]|nr:MAG: hypothetical protein A2255_05815 [Candidatus Melainabacteria bacterium RIFOXYA2_FULL_32_9]OGI28803.1 MAG: hypothetical protein A2287_09695 [Candidatus Melainabacteria bacterium RIFOXYA12_FULL_32_12]